MRPGTVLLTTRGDSPLELGYQLICSGYLVHRQQVLLVHHNRFDRWVPPGGHLEPGETFAEAAARECLEETGLEAEVLSAASVIHPADANASPEPVPFYVDVEREGFPVPALVQFFYLRLRDAASITRAVVQRSELFGLGWFALEDLENLRTFDQVRSLCRHVLVSHPDVTLPQR